MPTGHHHGPARRPDLGNHGPGRAEQPGVQPAVSFRGAKIDGSGIQRDEIGPLTNGQTPTIAPQGCGPTGAGLIKQPATGRALGIGQHSAPALDQSLTIFQGAQLTR